MDEKYGGLGSLDLGGGTATAEKPTPAADSAYGGIGSLDLSGPNFTQAPEFSTGPTLENLARRRQAAQALATGPNAPNANEYAAGLKAAGYNDATVQREGLNYAGHLALQLERAQNPAPLQQDLSAENLGKFGRRMLKYVARKEVPFADAIPSSVPVLGRLGQQSRDIEAAKKAFADGTANPYQVRLLAQTQRESEDDAVMGQNVAGKIVNLMGSAPKIIGEMEAGGAALRGAGGVVKSAFGLGKPALTAAELAQGGRLTSEIGSIKNAAGEVIDRVGTWSPQAARAALAEPGTARALATAAGQRALLTPLVPSMWLDEMKQRNLAAGRDVNDWAGAPPALAHGYLQMLVLGSMQSKFGLEGSFLKRTAVKGGIFAGEASSADAAYNLASRTISGADQFNTKYGTFEHLMSGQFGEAGKEAMVQVFTGALFAGMHEAQHGGEQPGKPIDPKVVDRRLEAVQADLDAMHKAGVPPKLALQRIKDMSQRVQEAAVKAESDPAGAKNDLADSRLPGTDVKSKVAEEGASMVEKTKPFDPFGHISDADLIDLGRLVTGKTKKSYSREEAISDLKARNINPSAFPGAKPPSSTLTTEAPPATPADAFKAARTDALAKGASEEQATAAGSRAAAEAQKGGKPPETPGKSLEKGQELHAAMHASGTAPKTREEYLNRAHETLAALPDGTEIYDPDLDVTYRVSSGVSKQTGKHSVEWEVQREDGSWKMSGMLSKRPGEKVLATGKTEPPVGKNLIIRKPPETPTVAPEGRSAGAGETPPGAEIARPGASGESEKPTEHYYRTPDSKGAEDNVDAAVKELIGDQFAGKWFSRTFEGNAGYKGHVQFEFHGGRLGGPKDVVEKGEKDVRIGGEAPMYLHPALTAIRYRGPESGESFAKLKDIVDTANGERAKLGIEPIELLSGKAAKEPRKLAEPAKEAPAEAAAPEFGKPLTAEEQAKGTTGGGSPEITAKPVEEGRVGGTAEEPKATALANEVTDAERAARGLPEIELSASVSDQKLYAEALQRMKDQPDLPARLVQEILDKPRPADPVESFVLLHRRVALSNEYERAMRLANHAFLSKQPKEEVDAAFARAENLLAEIDRTDRAIDKTGTETGRSLRIRRRMMEMDYSLSTMIGRAAGAKEEPLTPEETQKIADLQNRIAELTRKLDEATTKATADGAKKADVTKAKEEAATARIELADTKRKFEGMVTEFKYANLPVYKKVLTNVGEAFNFSRMLKTAFDLSAVFRQGGIFALSHPIISIRAARDMLRQFASKSYYERSEDALRQRPNAPLYERERVLADMHGPLNAREEMFVSRWLHGIAEVKPGESLARKFALLLPRGLVASERAFTGYLNRVRADVFDASLDALKRNGKPTDAEIHAIGNWVGVATGRGPMGAKLENSAGLMATLFFAPRYAISRFQLLAGQPLYGGTARTRQLIARDYARVGIGLSLFYLLNSLDDEAQITFDPRSTDFGKVRFGNTRIDPLTGMSQAVVFVTRLAAGEKTTQKGEVVPLREQYRWSAKGKVPYGGQKEGDVVLNFLRNKSAPIPSALADVLTGENTRGELTTASGTAENMAVPMVIGDVYEALQDQGMPRGAALSLLAILGMGSQVYEPRKKGKKAEETGPIKKMIQGIGG